MEEVVVRTLEEVPEGATHWSRRELRARVEEFKILTDPLLIDNFCDVVGLYPSPPEHAVVFSADDRPHIQAIGQSAPVLPMVPGTPSGPAATITGRAL
ncbi:hypothetical protein [Nonomuraea sp. NPDC049709]|uniref:hypothetical protein n=1 Tax=Nonomuraea sp. NPDC049709 TaxID=3154736 RepID=UPI00344403D1